MKVVSTEALTKLIQLVKSTFIKVDDVVGVTEIDTETTSEIETETPSEVELADVATSGSYNDLSNKPTIPTVTSTYTATGTDAVNGLAVSNAIATKQDNLVSGTNIKTINGNNLLGSGNIEIQGGGTVDSTLSLTSENPVQNKVITSTLSELSASINIDSYLDMIIAGNTSYLPIIAQSTYSDDLDDIIGGIYDNNI